MKAGFFIATFCLISINIALVYSRIANNLHSNGRTSVTITETDSEYTLSASFNVNKTGRVQDYINHCLKPRRLFQSPQDNIDAITPLNDNTQFHVKESPGELKIVLDKRKSSMAAYYQVRRMCEGVRDVLRAD